MKKLGKWWQWALLAAFAAALVFGAVQAKQVGDHLQYLVPAPAQQTEARPNSTAASRWRIGVWMPIIRYSLCKLSSCSHASGVFASGLAACLNIA